MEIIKEAIEQYLSDRSVDTDLLDGTDIKMSVFVQALLDYSNLNYITPQGAMEMLQKYHSQREALL